MTNFIEALNWRYATKRMTGEKIPQEKLNNILEAIRLSASSLGMQPYSIFVIQDKQLLNTIYQEACKQPQIIEASHVLVFAALKNVDETEVENYMQHIAQTRNVGLETLEGFKKGILSFLSTMTPEKKFEWAARQIYIALGTALAAAAIEKIDSTPIEGFSPEALDKIMNLEQQGLGSVVLLALGYRDNQNDYLVNAKKVRKHQEKLFIYQ